MTRKLIIHDGHAERELVLVGTIVVGRDPSCHITDLDPLLSRRHAEFITTARNVTIRDLGSRNGMLVNGEKIREHVLAEGDLVQLGHLQLRYIEDRTADTPEARTQSNATTAAVIDATRLSVVAGVDLEDTRPHPPPREPAASSHDDAAHVAAPRTAASASPAVVDVDATVASTGKSPASPEPADPLDDELTVAPGLRLLADKDATTVGRARAPQSLDATFASPGRALDATVASPDRALDATFASPGRPADATFASPGSAFDATFASPRAAVAAVAAPNQDSAAAATSIEPDARLIAGVDLRITAASPACAELFGAAPETLIGQTLGDLLERRLQALATAGGPSSLSFVVERSSSDRTLTLTIAAGQVLEIVS